MKTIILGKKIEYYVEGEGKDLLMIHGWVANKYQWVKWTNLLTKLGYRVWAIDLPGFGNSDSPENFWGINEYIETVEEFVKDRRMKNVTLLGHSLGSRLVLVLASKIKDVEKVVVFGVAGIKVSPIFTKIYTYGVKLVPFFLREFVGKKVFRISWWSHNDWEMGWKLSTQLERVMSVDISTKVRELKMPIYVGNGLWDYLTPIFNLRVFSGMKNVRFKIFNKSSHWPDIQQKKEFQKWLEVTLT